MVGVMDDDYVLKYIPVMTEEGKQAHFGEPEIDEYGYDIFPTGDTKEFEAFKRLQDDKNLNNEIDKILAAYLKHKDYGDFKKRLLFYLSRKKSEVAWKKQIHTAPNRKKLKRNLSKIDNSLSEMKFIGLLHQQYVEEISGQLKKQNPDISDFECFDTAQMIADFSDNLFPLMKRAINRTFSEIQKDDALKTLSEQEAAIKTKIANVLAEMLLKFFNLKPKNTTYFESPEILDRLFVLCCKTIRLKKASIQSDHVQNAIKKINQRLRNKKANSAP